MSNYGFCPVCGTDYPRDARYDYGACSAACREQIGQCVFQVVHRDLFTGAPMPLRCQRPDGHEGAHTTRLTDGTPLEWGV